MADDEDEGCRLARILGEKQVLMMGNHGVLVASRNIPEAFDTLYHLERACRTLMLAYARAKAKSPIAGDCRTDCRGLGNLYRQLLCAFQRNQAGNRQRRFELRKLIAAARQGDEFRQRRQYRRLARGRSH